MTRFLTPARRRAIYAVAVAVVPLLVLYGLLDVKAAPLVLPLVLALLNVPGAGEPDSEPHDVFGTED